MPVGHKTLIMCQQCPCSECILNECTTHLCIIPSIFQLPNWAFVRWKKHTVNYTRSLFAWGHFVWDRQLCYINLQQLCRKSKVLTKVTELLMLTNAPLLRRFLHNTSQTLCLQKPLSPVMTRVIWCPPQCSALRKSQLKSQHHSQPQQHLALQYNVKLVACLEM